MKLHGHVCHAWLSLIWWQAVSITWLLWTGHSKSRRTGLSPKHFLSWSTPGWDSPTQQPQDISSDSSILTQCLLSNCVQVWFTPVWFTLPVQPAPFYPSKVREKGLKVTPRKSEFRLRFDLAHLPLRVSTEDGASETTVSWVQHQKLQGDAECTVTLSLCPEKQCVQFISLPLPVLSPSWFPSGNALSAALKNYTITTFDYVCEYH